MVQFLDKNSGFNQWNANRAATQKKSGFSSFLWWMGMFFLAWWTVGLIMGPTQQPQTQSEEVVTVDVSSVPTSRVLSDTVDATVQGLRISDIKLVNYPTSSADSAPVSLLGADDNYIEIGLLANGTVAPTATTVWQGANGNYSWRGPSGMEYNRTVSANDYIITITDTIKNASKQDVSFAPYARVVRAKNPASSAGVNTGAITYANSDIETRAWSKLDKKSYAYTTTNGFTGFADQYWQTVVSIDSPDQTMRIKKSGDNYVADTAAGAVTVPAGETKSIVSYIFAGPREQKILDAAEAKIAGIGESIDYGWFWFLARPMLWLLNAINSTVMNYGVAIIIMTLLLRLCIWPLTRKSYTNMAIMQKMQPEMQRIQKLYANDKVRLQMEMMKLYQTHKTSPMAGCLPMLIQIPVFFALYKALLISVQMRNAHFLWISDLSVMDPYFILPILMGATMWIQQYLQSPKTVKSTGANDTIAQTQKMMRWMPILFTIMFAWMPAGLVLYWTVSNVLGIIQMQIIKRTSK